MRTSNPALSPNVFTGIPRATSVNDTMTVSGAMNKTGILLLLALLSAGYMWNVYYTTGSAQAVVPWMWGGSIVGFITAMVVIFKKEWASVLAPAYALLQGIFLGSLSALMDHAYPGIVIQAVGGTFGTLAMMLFLYKTGIIQVTDKLRMGIVAATGAVVVVYLVGFVMSLFGASVPFLYSSSLWSIGFSILVVGIAAFNLLLDFDFIEQGASHGLPRYMEWYAAFGLMVTLVWLYIEILRLLSKLRER